MHSHLNQSWAPQFSGRITQTSLALIATFCLLSLPITGLGSDYDLDSRNWKLVTSNNFRVHTVLSEERATEMLRHLEIMRATLGNPASTATFQAAVPTVILALDSASDYYLIGAPEKTVGIFFADQRENAIIVQDNDGVQGVRTILHEYVHYLHRQNGRINSPRWYEEGHAEYLSSSRLQESRYEFGLPIPARLSSLTLDSWLPMKTVLEMSDLSNLSLEEGDLFYSQSWLLVHYLHSLPNAEQSISDNLDHYVQMIINGSSPTDAFELAFSISFDHLKTKLQRYLLDDEFETRAIAIDSALPNFTPGVENVAKPDIQIALAEMAMRFDNDIAAEHWFTAALQAEESRPRAEAGLGTVFGHRGEVAKANARFEAAIYLVSYDFRMWMDYAQFWAERVAQSTDFEKRGFYAGRLEEALRSALTISDATPELNSLMGFAYLARGKDIEEAIEYLTDATEQSPTDQGSRLLLANAYLYADEYALAIDVAESIIGREHQKSALTMNARQLIDRARERMALDRRR